MVRRIALIAVNDLRRQLRQLSTLVWILVMPPVFFYFIGTVTGGFGGGGAAGELTPLAVTGTPDFARDQIERRLRENEFEPSWLDDSSDAGAQQAPSRLLSLPDRLGERIAAGEQVSASYETDASELLRDFEAIRIQRSLYTVLADIVVADAAQPAPVDAGDLDALNAAPRHWQLSARPAGNRQTIPLGFEQSIPGNMVMFTLLVLLTNGAPLLVMERRAGLLRRLASAPISRSELVAGKWLSRMALALVQLLVAVLAGTLLFGMDWGPDVGMVMLVLVAWAAFCASAGLLLGGVAGTESQASGLGLLASMSLAALGGCWWPIEVTPEWMQSLQKLLPTGWTMDALHRLISFEAGASTAVVHTLALLVGAVLVGALAVRYFRYQ